MFGISSFRPVLKAGATSSALARSFSASARRDYARLTVAGRLGATPELTTTSAGTEFVRYAVATSHGPKDNQKTSWFRVGSFVKEGPRRDFILSLEKGSLVLIEGEVSTSAYEVGDGKKIPTHTITERSLSLLQRGRSQEESG